MSEERFHSLIDKVILSYQDIFKLYGAKNFNVFREWENSQVNAATRKKNGNFEMIVYGGLARFEPLTDDGFLLVLCHEVGHLIGGAPTYKPLNDASSEGQADYFSTSKCFKKLMSNEKISISSKDDYDPLALSKCEESYDKKSHDYKVCLRASRAIESLSTTIAKLSGLKSVPQFDTPDPYVRRLILFNGYPTEQCRIDTAFAGSLCPKDYSDLNDMALYNKGNCSVPGGDFLGLRPRCWYVPREDN
ncbi:hypothetical protein M900_1216 [Bacteriovorax sp. Seq25_V]|nr:hypothetical protein M900_1216 [Bacteriovorax sp. Seq25_V]